MPRKCVALAALVFAIFVPSVHAQNCAPFTDVLASSGFCGNIQWLYNRGITLGCTPSQFCPSQFVRRDQMAAFLYRLGFENAFLHGGNAFGEPAVLGTTDNQSLDIRVNGVRAIRYVPHPISASLIGGYAGNSITPGVEGATIGGGGGTFQAIDGTHTITDSYGTVAGGFNNSAGDFAGDLFDAVAATVGGGAANRALGPRATVSGGANNWAQGEASAVAGGAANQALGRYSTVGGGTFNVATGDYSFVAGSYARANGHSCVVFSLWQAPPGMQCFGVQSQFMIGALHGLSVDYHAQRADGGGTRYVYIGNNFPPFTITTWNGATLGDNGVWNSVSDVTKKEAFAEVDKQAILERLAALPIRSFRYRVETDDVRHIGPTGQDFRAAFGLGDDEKTIGSVDADGIALAAIQGLNAKLEAKLAEQAREVVELRQLVTALMAKLEIGK